MLPMVTLLVLLVKAPSPALARINSNGHTTALHTSMIDAGSVDQVSCYRQPNCAILLNDNSFIIGHDNYPPPELFVTVVGFPPDTSVSFYILPGFNKINPVGLFVKAITSRSKLLAPVGIEVTRITNSQGIYKGNVHIPPSAKEATGRYTLYAYATYTRSLGNAAVKSYAVAYHELIAR
jgi:hypothetical protein